MEVAEIPIGAMAEAVTQEQTASVESAEQIDSAMGMEVNPQ